jgi:molybdopterin synthase catalytic subunit
MSKTPLEGRIRVSEAPIEPGELAAEVGAPGAGAVVVFLGTVRDHSSGKEGVTHLEYEAYQEQIEDKIGEIVAEAGQRWPLLGVVVEHRVGRVDVGEASVGVAVSSAHRDEAFIAARYLIDELKQRAPIWKKEHWPGGADWVEGS